jgi:hypothetical protein
VVALYATHCRYPRQRIGKMSFAVASTATLVTATAARSERASTR